MSDLADRTLAATIACLLAAMVVASTARAQEGESGDIGSSYVRGPYGSSVYYHLLKRAGHRVVRQDESLAEHRPDPGDLLVVIGEGSITTDDVNGINDHVGRGGRALLVGGYSEIGSHARSGEPTYDSHTGGLELQGSEGIGLIDTDGDVFDEASVEDRVLVRDRYGKPAGIAAANGRLILLADMRAFTNRAIVAGGNAAYALKLSGRPEQRVIILESVHATTDHRSGLALLPPWLKRLLLMLLLAGLVWLLVIGRRFGPVDRIARRLLPERREHVDVLAERIAAAPDAGRMAVTLAEAARERLARRFGLGRTPSDEQLITVAHRAGIHGAALAALIEPEQAKLTAAGEALARANSKTREDR